jgi:predicted aspartyl protease
MLVVAGQPWRAIIDTGFNGDLELPDSFRFSVHPRYRGRTQSILAGGQAVVEDYYQVDFPFDGEAVLAEATFVPGNEILIGTQLLQRHRLEINFPAGTVLLERIP